MAGRAGRHKGDRKGEGMNLFDIIGPVMVGPSSSHTAGAAKIGKIGGALLGEKISRAEIFFHGSFLATGKGHGTDKALVAGLLGMRLDDEKLPESFALAEQRGLDFAIKGIDLGDVHPNSVKLSLTGSNGKTLEMTASSVGGGSVRIYSLDGMDVSFSGDYPTLLIHSLDETGLVKEVASLLAHKAVNIAAMQLGRAKRGGNAVMVLECDQELPTELLAWLRKVEGILNVTYLSLKE